MVYMEFCPFKFKGIESVISEQLLKGKCYPIGLEVLLVRV